MTQSVSARFEGLPGVDLVEQGLDDLREDRRTVNAALVALAAPRLRALAIECPAGGGPNPGHALYDLLSNEDRASAHGRYNALVGRMVSFARAAEHARAG